jgi:regulatory protein
MSQEEALAERDALRLITRAEQCSAGLIRKLKKRGHEAAYIDAVVSRLMEQNLVNDLRFAQLWLVSRLRQPRSPRRLLVGLYGRGIDRDDAETALKNALDDETELALLKRYVKKHSKKIVRGRDGTLSLKFLLKSEGFSPQTIERFFDDELE